MKLRDLVANSLPRVRGRKKKTVQTPPPTIPEGVDRNQSLFQAASSRESSVDRCDPLETLWRGNAIYQGPPALESRMVTSHSSDGFPSGRRYWETGGYHTDSHKSSQFSLASENLSEIPLCAVNGTRHPVTAPLRERNAYSASNVAPLGSSAATMDKNGRHHSKSDSKSEMSFFKKSLASFRGITRRNSSRSKTFDKLKQPQEGEKSPTENPREKRPAKPKRRSFKFHSKDETSERKPSRREHHFGFFRRDRDKSWFSDNDTRDGSQSSGGLPRLSASENRSRECSVESCSCRIGSSTCRSCSRERDFSGFDSTSLSGYDSDCPRYKVRRSRSRIKTNPWLPSPQPSASTTRREMISEPRSSSRSPSLLRNSSLSANPEDVVMLSGNVNASRTHKVPDTLDRVNECGADHKKWWAQKRESRELNDLSTEKTTSRPSSIVSPHTEFVTLTGNIEQLAQNISFEYEEALDTTLESISMTQEDTVMSFQDILTDDESLAMSNNTATKQTHKAASSDNSPDSGISGLASSDGDETMTTPTVQNAEQESFAKHRICPSDHGVSNGREYADSVPGNPFPTIGNATSGACVMNDRNLYCAQMINFDGRKLTRGFDVNNGLFRHEDQSGLECVCHSRQKVLATGESFGWKTPVGRGIIMGARHTLQDRIGTPRSRSMDEFYQREQQTVARLRNRTSTSVPRPCALSMPSCFRHSLQYEVQNHGGCQDNNHVYDRRHLRQASGASLDRHGSQSRSEKTLFCQCVNTFPGSGLNDIEKKDSTGSQSRPVSGEFSFPPNIPMTDSLESPTDNCCEMADASVQTDFRDDWSQWTATCDVEAKDVTFDPFDPTQSWLMTESMQSSTDTGYSSLTRDGQLALLDDVIHDELLSVIGEDAARVDDEEILRDSVDRNTPVPWFEEEAAVELEEPMNGSYRYDEATPADAIDGAYGRMDFIDSRGDETTPKYSTTPNKNCWPQGCRPRQSNAMVYTNKETGETGSSPLTVDPDTPKRNCPRDEHMEEIYKMSLNCSNDGRCDSYVVSNVQRALPPNHSKRFHNERQFMSAPAPDIPRSRRKSDTSGSRRQNPNTTKSTQSSDVQCMISSDLVSDKADYLEFLKDTEPSSSHLERPVFLIPTFDSDIPSGYTISSENITFQSYSCSSQGVRSRNDMHLRSNGAYVLDQESQGARNKMSHVSGEILKASFRHRRREEGFSDFGPSNVTMVSPPSQQTRLKSTSSSTRRAPTVSSTLGKLTANAFDLESRIQLATNDAVSAPPRDTPPSNGSGRTLEDITRGLAEKVRLLRREKHFVYQKIREAKEDEMVREQQRLKFQRQLNIHRKQILLETLHEIRNSLEAQSRRLQCSYSAVLDMQGANMASREA